MAIDRHDAPTRFKAIAATLETGFATCELCQAVDCERNSHRQAISGLQVLYDRCGRGCRADKQEVLFVAFARDTWTLFDECAALLLEKANGDDNIRRLALSIINRLPSQVPDVLTALHDAMIIVGDRGQPSELHRKQILSQLQGLSLALEQTSNPRPALDPADSPSLLLDDPVWKGMADRDKTLIGAIKRVRTLRYVSLAEAKAWVETHRVALGFNPSPFAPLSTPVKPANTDEPPF
jgi:hypothetical protein